MKLRGIHLLYNIIVGRLKKYILDFKNLVISKIVLGISILFLK